MYAHERLLISVLVEIRQARQDVAGIDVSRSPNVGLIGLCAKCCRTPKRFECGVERLEIVVFGFCEMRRSEIVAGVACEFREILFKPFLRQHFFK